MHNRKRRTKNLNTNMANYQCHKEEIKNISMTIMTQKLHQKMLNLGWCFFFPSSFLRIYGTYVGNFSVTHFRYLEECERTQRRMRNLLILVNDRDWWNGYGEERGVVCLFPKKLKVGFFQENAVLWILKIWIELRQETELLERIERECV